MVYTDTNVLLINYCDLIKKIITCNKNKLNKCKILLFIRFSINEKAYEKVNINIQALFNKLVQLFSY